MGKKGQYPRIRKLPKHEQAPFRKWLAHQTCPVGDERESQSERDWYYPWDYERWKQSLSVTD